MMVRVENDAEKTGGYLIYQWWDGSNGPNQNDAFDDWVETMASLERYFDSSGWQIEWEPVKK